MEQLDKLDKLDKLDSERFRVEPSASVKLKDLPTGVAPVYESKKHYKKLLKSQIARLSDLQERLYATDSFALLMVFQAMDAAGKDSMIEHVMSGINPQGCQVFSFKHPSPADLDHDFLWRTVAALPERGRIGIFNRSYYEEVLIVRVHPEILAGERLPDGITEDGKIWDKRYESIREHEKHLARNGTKVIKFFLHVSKEEQRKRFLDRIDQPEKNWKFSMGDVKEREYWDHYMDAFEQALSNTSTKDAPWYVIPADDKRNARLFVADVVREAMEALHVDFPVPTPQHLEELAAARLALEAEGSESLRL